MDKRDERVQLKSVMGKRDKGVGLRGMREWNERD